MAMLSHYGDTDNTTNSNSGGATSSASPCDPLYILVMLDSDPRRLVEIKIRGGGFFFKPTGVTVDLTLRNCHYGTLLYTRARALLLLPLGLNRRITRDLCVCGCGDFSLTG